MPEEIAVVLGASEFIGTRLVAQLRGRGVRVRALDIVPPRARLDGVDYADADVREPIPVRHAEGAGVIYNLAAVHRTPGHPDHEYYDTNIAGALNGTALAEAAGVATTVFTSSISVYGPCEATVSEHSPLAPVTAYGRSKRLAERIHDRWLALGGGRRLVVVRPGVVFGPGEFGNYAALARALRAGYFAFPGRKDTVKSGGYVDELLRTLDFALARGEPKVLFNFAYPEVSATEDIVAAFGRVMGRRFRPPTMPVAPLLAFAAVAEAAGVLGLKTSIHRDRVMKLVQSTRIDPAWLKSNGYAFSTDLERALALWRDETAGRFV